MVDLPPDGQPHAVAGRTRSCGTRSRHYLDNMQNWLAAESDKTHPNIAYRVIHWISSGLDALVRWLYHLLSRWLTWPGTTVLGGLLALRFGGRRAAAIMVASFAAFAALGLWDESMQTLALMLVAVALSLLVGVPLGVVAGRSDRVQPADHAGARRDADHPGVRLPDAGRHLLLRRAGGRGDHDDGLLGPAGGAHHGARHPRRPGEHGRGGDRARVDRAPGALEGAAAARAPPAAALGEPDDPLRPLDGRDRGPDQHRGRARRAGDERPQLEPGARDPRGRRRSS